MHLEVVEPVAELLPRLVEQVAELAAPVDLDLPEEGDPLPRVDALRRADAVELLGAVALGREVDPVAARAPARALAVARELDRRPAGRRHGPDAAGRAGARVHLLLRDHRRVGRERPDLG